MVARPLGGALGGSTRNQTDQSLGALTVPGKTAKFRDPLVFDPENPFDFLEGLLHAVSLASLLGNHHVFRPVIRAPRASTGKQPPTLAGDKNRLLLWLITSDSPAVHCI
jgi:hypothetical protein